MGFFAVVRLDGAPLEVPECHLNFWALRGPFRHVFLWDVGVKLKSGEQPVSSVGLALPFVSHGSVLRDLSSKILNDLEVASLIFGSKIDKEGDTIHLRSAATPKSFPIKQVSVTESRVNAARSTENGTFWEVKLAEPLLPNSEGYFRVRFTIRSLGRIWIWQKLFLGKNGALLDLRVSDVREAIQIPEWSEILHKIVPIGCVNIFAVVPGWLHLMNTSPRTHYIRLMEGLIWEKYVDQLTDLRRKSKLLIYQWRSEKDSAVTTERPFRAFADFINPNGLLSVGNYWRAAIVLAIALWVANHLNAPLHRMLDSAQDALLKDKRKWWSIPTIVVAVGLIYKWKKPISDIFTWFSWKAREFEDWLRRRR